MRGKKGLTPVIAVILLLMMTVAAAGAAFFWFVRVQSELQGGEEQYAQSLAERVSAKVDVTLAQYTKKTADTHGNLTLILRNTGSVPVSMVNGTTSPKITWILQDSEQKIICNQDWAYGPSQCISGCGSADLGVASSSTIILNLTGACDINSDTTYPNDSVFYYKIDFAGVTATGGSFKK